MFGITLHNRNITTTDVNDGVSEPIVLYVPDTRGHAHDCQHLGVTSCSRHNTLAAHTGLDAVCMAVLTTLLTENEFNNERGRFTGLYFLLLLHVAKNSLNMDARQTGMKATRVTVLVIAVAAKNDFLL